MHIKSDLRKQAAEKRKQIDCKQEKDFLIVKNLLALDEYLNAKTVLIYASLDDEIKTDNIIKTALDDKKTVAVPLCLDKDGKMEFYSIDSLSNLKKGNFGVREPSPDESKLINDFSEAIIIVPGLLFDKEGNRLGFGKGYYDRYLAKNEIFSIGLCYNEMMIEKVPVDEYDKNIDKIVTQSGVINCKSGG